MLKVYVEANIRLREAMDGIVNKFTKAKESQDGFASAETIALAVVGVLLVFGIYAIFKDQIGKQLEKWIPSIFSDAGGSSGTTTTLP